MGWERFNAPKKKENKTSDFLRKKREEEMERTRKNVKKTARRGNR